MISRRLHYMVVLMAIPIYVSASAESSEWASMARCSIALKGQASGGKLVLAENMGRNARYVAIVTREGESAASVAERLAEAINSEKDPLGWVTENPSVTASGGTLQRLAGDKTWYFFAGTEMGLGIPDPPLSLSCSYDIARDQVEVRWENPADRYDSILVVLNWSNFDRRSEIRLPGTSISLLIDRKKRPVDVNDLDVWVNGYRDGIASNVAAIHLNGSSQEELYGIPFTDNVAPNWTGWLMARDKNAVEFQEGVRERFLSSNPGNRMTHPATKPFYQIIGTKSSDARAGVWRKFLGLKPGHTYRVAARISTLEMDSAEWDWSFSLHAAYNSPGGNDLTVAQLAGLAALPDGGKGAAAGRIALYEPSLTTKGTWEARSTGKPWRDVPIPPDITLPPGVDTITVWVTCQGAGPSAFGIDWVKLEDITAAGEAKGEK